MGASVRFRFSHVIGFYALVGRGFNNPVDMALGRDGLLYVLDRGGSDIPVRMDYKRITICNVAEDYVGAFGTGGSEDGQMMWPSGIAVSGAGNIYVSDDSLHRVSVFDAQGQFVNKWGTKGSNEGQLNRPAGIAFDKEGNLLVVDSLNNRVQCYTEEGKLLGSWGRGGRGHGEFNLPWGISVDHAGDIYVADWRNDRIQKFDTGGNYLATFGTSGQGEGQFYRPAGVAADREGLVYVADWGNERVQVLNPDGSFLAQFRGEAGLSKWSHDYFIPNKDELEERLKANMEPELDLPAEDFLRNQSASVEKLFWGPTSVKVDDQGRIYVVDSCRHRVQVYTKDAKPVANRQSRVSSPRGKAAAARKS